MKKKATKEQIFLWSALEKKFPITGEGTVISPEEIIVIDGLGEFDSKVDSGNDGYNVLHVDEYEVHNTDGLDNVLFKSHGKILSSPLIEWIDVKKGSDNERRPVVHLDIFFAGTSHQGVPFSLANRNGYDEPILIGKPFLTDIKAEIKFS